MRASIIHLLLVVAVLFSGCHSAHREDSHGHQHAEGYSHDHDHEGHDHDHSGEDAHHHEAGHAGEITFTKQQAKAAGLAIETVTPGVFQQVIKTSGQILPAQGDEVTVVATANGTVLFAGPSIAEGAAVRAGETIATVSAGNLPDGDPAVKAKIAYETAEKEFRRAEALVKDQIISEKEFEQIRLRYETARTAYQAQAANMTAKGVRVTSPIAGYIKSLLAGQGEYVTVGQPVAVVSQNKRLQLRAEVSENYYKSLKHITSAHFRPSYDNTVHKLSDLNGRLLSFGKAAGQSSFLPVTFEFNNTGDIIPGAFAEVFLLANPLDNVISVPATAVTEEQGLYFVYLQVHDESYIKQEVSPGPNDGERVQLLSGLKEGDRVVTKGVYQVKLAAMASVIPEGHSHSH